MGKPQKHKRKGPKSTRAGCLLCKPHKHQNVKGTKEAKRISELKADQDAKDQNAL